MADETSELANTRFDRRSLLARGAGVAAGLAWGGARLADVARAASPKPKKGGTLIVGSLGSPSDTLDVPLGTTNIDAERAFNLGDTLTYFDHTSQTLRYGLAESIEMTSGAKVATIRLRSGVTFHNGKTVTADDLLYSLRRILNPKTRNNNAAAYESINLRAMKKLDKRTVRLDLNYPDSVLPARFNEPNVIVIPSTGFDPAHPVSTGPFKFKSFVPGQRSEFVRNENYWVNGQPYVDELTIIDFPDDTSRVNALLGGQILALDGLPLTQLPLVRNRSDLKILEATSGYIQPIVMRVDRPPFNDVRVRQAFQLIVDRQQMVDLVYNGHGRLGNDMLWSASAAYPSGLPQRKQDLEKAKSLLRAAGKSDLSVTLVTAPEDSGLVPGAQIFAENAKSAGVKVNVRNIPPPQYDPGFPNWTFTQGYYAGQPFGVEFSLNFLPGAVFNDCHWSDAKSIALYRQGLGTIDESKRNELFREVEMILHERGGYIIHSFRNAVDAYSSKLTGFVGDSSTGWGLGAWRFREVSFA